MIAARLMDLWLERDSRYRASSHYRSIEAMRGAYRWRCGELDELPSAEPRKTLRDALSMFQRRWGIG